MARLDFPDKSALNICFAHVAYQLATTFEKRESGIQYFRFGALKTCKPVLARPMSWLFPAFGKTTY